MTGATCGMRKKRSTIACQITPPARIAMNSTLRRASKPSSAATAAATGNSASGTSVGIGLPRVAASTAQPYSAIANATSSSARVAARGNSETPGTPVPASVMNAGNSGIAKNAMPSATGIARVRPSVPIARARTSRVPRARSCASTTSRYSGPRSTPPAAGPRTLVREKPRVAGRILGCLR